MATPKNAVATKNICKFDKYPIDDILNKPGMSKLISYITPIPEMVREYTCSVFGKYKVRTYIDVITPFLVSINDSLLKLNTPVTLKIYITPDFKMAYETIDRRKEQANRIARQQSGGDAKNMYEILTTSIFFTLTITFMAWTMNGVKKETITKHPSTCPTLTIYDVFNLLWNSSTISSVAMSIVDKNVNIAKDDLYSSICPDKINALRTKILTNMEELALSLSKNDGKNIMDLLKSSFDNTSATLQPMMTLIFDKACMSQGLNIDGTMNLSKQKAAAAKENADKKIKAIQNAMQKGGSKHKRSRVDNFNCKCKFNKRKKRFTKRDIKCNCKKKTKKNKRNKKNKRK